LNWLWQGDRFHPSADLPSADRGFRYGMSFFETVAIRSGCPVLLDAHLALLRNSLCASRWPIPERALDAVAPLLESATTANHLARIYVTAGAGGPRDPVTSPGILLLSEGHTPPNNRDALPDIRLVTLSQYPWPDALPGRKTGNYWPSIQSLSDAIARGADEAIRCDGGGEVISASMANVFAVIAGAVITPPAWRKTDGTGGPSKTRPGVTRAWALDRAKALGLPIVERVLHSSELAEAAEIFLTNSRIGILPARQLDGRTLPKSDLGQQLARIFDAEFPWIRRPPS
jgi:branched-subunit amino acid aminotransferase/4-amino-4-deoxychorismate lyase